MISTAWLVWLGSFLYWGLAIEARNPRVAVCIQGQIRRWLPQLILPNLIESNPDIDLVFFVNLQYPTKSQGSHYSTLSHLTLSPSNVSQATFESSLTQVHEQWTTNHSSIGQIAFHNPYPREYFQEKFQTTRLAVIEQYEAVQHLILNMYSHQEHCITQLQEYEINVFQNKYNSTVESSASNTSKHFDYVLSLREDIYFFRPLVLRTVIDQYLLNPQGVALQDSVGKGQKRDVGCHIVQKNCLRWSGLNMRGQLLRREHALAFLGQRLSYYNQNVQTHQEILNPEGWELKQLHDLHLRACDVPVDLFPITVARNLPGGKYCFIPFEIMHKCIPRGMHQEINALDCHKVLRQASNSDTGKT